MDDLIYNYMAFLEVIYSDEEVPPEIVLQKYGLIKLTPKEIRGLETMEMKRLYEDNITLNEIGRS